MRTLTTTVARLRARGHIVETITPDQFRTIPCPTYPDIRLALGAGRRVRAGLAAFAPQAVHIATEGPLGWAARRWCLAGDMPFTTSLHTRFPDYLRMRTGLSADLFWPALVRFHRPARRIFVSTASLAEELARRGLDRTHRWSRGVDLGLFSADVAPSAALAGLPRPIQLYVGRVAVEKNIEDFLRTNIAGTKVVVGDGPARESLSLRFPDVRFTGALHGQALAEAYAAADVFVFPSRTDTFGMVMIEALASGVPVAAYPVPGPLDVIGSEGRGERGDATIGALDDDLESAIRQALNARPADCARAGAAYDWDRCTDQFLAGLEPRAGSVAVAPGSMIERLAEAA